MQISQLFGGGSFAAITGNGYLVHHEGQFFARSLIGSGQVPIENPEGIAGPTRWGGVSPGLLASADDLDGNSTADQVVPVLGADSFIIRRIVFWGATATPSALAGGLYTLPDKGGSVLVPASQSFAALTDDLAVVEITPDPAVRRIPFLYWSPTTAQGAALTLKVAVFGDIVALDQDF